MAASAKRTARTLAASIFALCLLIPLGACAYQQESDALQSLASTTPNESAESASGSDAGGKTDSASEPAEDKATTGEEAGSASKDATAEPGSDTSESKSDANDNVNTLDKATGTPLNNAPSDGTNAAISADAEKITDASGKNAGSNAGTTPEKDANLQAAKSADGAKAEGELTTATIMYYENVNYEDGDVKPDEEGHVLLGTYELTDVHVGQTLNAWNYVVDIPGFFFWDGWPQNLTLTENASDNVIKLFYFKLWNNEYTVNYYLMENADLSADNWKDALEPDDVKFVKMGSETFTDQRFDKLVKGDAYEYKIDGTYVVDTYPSEIHVGVSPDDNVINVLYVPDSATLPDDIEIPDNITPPEGITPPASDGATPPNDAAQPGDTTQPDEGNSSGNNGNGSNGDDTSDGNGNNGDGGNGEGSGNSNGNNGGAGNKPVDDPDANKPADAPSTDEGSSPNLPNDTTFDKDEIEGALPDNVKDEVVKDFIESGEGQDKVEITDEMIENPVSKSDADYVKNVYETGLKEGERLAQTGDLVPFTIVASIALGAAAAGIIAFIMSRRAKR